MLTIIRFVTLYLESGRSTYGHDKDLTVHSNREYLLTTFSPPKIRTGFLKLNGGSSSLLLTSLAKTGYDGDGEGVTAKKERNALTVLAEGSFLKGPERYLTASPVSYLSTSTPITAYSPVDHCCS